jgi:hypothetical protein
MKTILLLGAIVAALAGCGEDKVSQAPPQTGPLVTFARGGGIASQPKELVVDRRGNGKLTVQTGMKVTHSDLTLSARKLDELEAAIEGARGVELPKTDVVCADCFIYDIKADGVAYRLDSISYSDAGTPAALKDLVGILDGLAGA